MLFLHGGNGRRCHLSGEERIFREQIPVLAAYSGTANCRRRSIEPADAVGCSFRADRLAVLFRQRGVPRRPDDGFGRIGHCAEI